MRRRAVFLVSAVVVVIVCLGVVRARRRQASLAALEGRIVADGGGPAAPAPGGDTTWIACGDARCSLAREACCVYPFPVDREPPPPAWFACVVGARCPAAAIGPRGGPGPPSALRCAGAANCAHGAVCCIRVDGRLVSSSCVDPDECGAESEEEEGESRRGGMHAQLCDPRAGAASGCPATAPCSSAGAAQWQLPPGYGTCGVADEGPY